MDLPRIKILVTTNNILNTRGESLSTYSLQTLDKTQRNEEVIPSA